MKPFIIISKMAICSLTLLLRWKQRTRFVICHGIFDHMTPYVRKSFFIIIHIVICSLTLLLRWRQHPSQVSHGIFDNVCIMYIISNEIISYCHIFCDIFFTLLLWEQNWIRSESKFYCN